MPTKQHKKYFFRARVWIWPGAVAAWHFLSLPKEMSLEIKERYGKHARGWRSIPVSVTVGKVTWKTSIFPDSKSGNYLLPLKSQVRKEEEIFVDDDINVKLTIV